jgi:uncharacterized membrane protein
MSKQALSVLFPLAFVLALIFVLSLSLRVYRIDHQSFWMDEIYTLRIAPLPWPEMSKMIDKSDNGKPPLYNLFMHSWLQNGTSEFVARLPSAFFGAATCIVAALLGAFFLGARGWIVGLLLAFSPFHVWYSQEARLYTLLGLFSALAFYFHCLYCRDKKGSELICFVIFGVLTCYTFPYGFFFLAVTSAYAFFQRPPLSTRQLGLDALAHLVVFGSFALWIPRMIHAAVTTAQIHKGRDLEMLAYSFNNLFFGSSIGVAPEQLHQPISPFHQHPIASIILLLTFIISVLVFLSGLKILREENWNAFVFGSLGVVVFLGGPFLISIIKPTITNNPRYAFMALIPVLVVVAAFLLNAVAKASVPHRLLGGFLLAGIVLSLFNYYYVSAYSRDNMRAAAHEINNDKSIDAVFVCNDCEVPTMAHYYRGPAPIIGIQYPPGGSENQEAQWIRDHAGTAQHPVLVYLRPDIGDPQSKLPPLFQTLFHVKKSQEWSGVTLYEYDANQTPAQ